MRRIKSERDIYSPVAFKCLVNALSIRSFISGDIFSSICFDSIVLSYVHLFHWLYA